MHVSFPPSATVEDCIQAGATAFLQHQLCFGHGTDNAHDEAALLLLHALNWSFDALESAYHQPLNQRQLDAVADLFEQRIESRRPAAYLTGEAWFAGMPFRVTRDVLVPRSPFAELIEDRFAPWVDEASVSRILDLCTGSGCIAIACALAFKDAAVDAVDLSTAALDVAKANVADHELKDRVTVIRSDLFDALTDQVYDLIVSNPPYVSHAEMATLPDEYQAEPQMGFDGGIDGLTLVHRLLAQAPEHLSDHGVLYVEVGSSAEVLQTTYPEVPFLWQEFEYGGDGVFMLTKQQLLQHQHQFKAHADA